jgi:hypothetical protein
LTSANGSNPFTVSTFSKDEYTLCSGAFHEAGGGLAPLLGPAPLDVVSSIAVLLFCDFELFPLATVATVAFYSSILISAILIVFGSSPIPRAESSSTRI